MVKSIFSLPIFFPTSRLHLNKTFVVYEIIDLPILSLAGKMKMIEKHIRRNDLVGKKIRILAETQKFESGLSTNKFRCRQSRARSYITETRSTRLCDSLLPFGVSMLIQMALSEAPEIMDIALGNHLSSSQIQSLSRARLHNKMIHIGKYTYTDVD